MRKDLVFTPPKSGAEKAPEYLINFKISLLYATLKTILNIIQKIILIQIIRQFVQKMFEGML
jgi:hypothetical protein